MPIGKADAKIFLEPILNAAFFKAFDTTVVDDLSWVITEVPSNKDKESYGWLGASSGMKEFKNERVPEGLSTFDYSLKNKKWEDTISVSRDEIDDDLYGQIKMRINALAENAKRHKAKLITDAFNNAFVTTYGAAYDSIALCGTHTINGSSYANIGVSGVGVGLNPVLSAQAVKEGFVKMAACTDDKGNKLGIVPNILFVAPDLQFIADEIVNSGYGQGSVGSGEQLKNANVKNSLAGKLTVKVGAGLTAGYWFLIDTNHGIKPIIFQDRAPVEFGAMEGQSESGFMREEYYYGIRARYNVGYGMFQYVWGSKGTGS